MPGIRAASNVPEVILLAARAIFECAAVVESWVDTLEVTSESRAIVEATRASATVPEAILLPARVIFECAVMVELCVAISESISADSSRLAAVTWVQSRYRDPQAREILYDLHKTRKLMNKKGTRGLEVELIDKTYNNLIRRWAEF